MIIKLLLTLQILSIVNANQAWNKFKTSFNSDLLQRQSTLLKEIISINQGHLFDSPVLYQQFLSSILNFNKSDLNGKLLQCSKSDMPRQFKFGGAQVGFIGNESDFQTKSLKKMKDDCFDQVNVTFRKMNSSQIVLDFTAGKKRTQGCSQWYYVGTGANLHMASIDFNKNHRMTWKNLNTKQMKNIQTWAIHIFRGCDHLRNVIPNLLQTAQLFIGGLGTNPKIPFFGSHTPRYMQQLNVKFIEDGTGYKWEERPYVFTDLDNTQVHPGDFLAITRFDGLDQIIQYGAGSHSGHSCVIMEVDGQLVVVQSQDGWYWPKHGIQRNSWKQWKQWAKNAGFNVAVLPLSQESRAKFDVTAAAEHFKKMQGFPYGYHNFLFGWIDTPKDNFPPILDQNLILVLFAHLQKIAPAPIKKILTQALNMRLGTQNLDIGDITLQMAQRNMSFGDLMAIVERDEWWYSDGWSQVCSSFVAGIYQAGGLLPDIQATQFTPKDVYTLTIFDKNFKVSEKCKKNDPDLPYCQIMGRYRMNLPGYSTIDPYPHMAEHCPTMLPDFKRKEGC